MNSAEGFALQCYSFTLCAFICRIYSQLYNFVGYRGIPKTISHPIEADNVLDSRTP